jgi:hypothetical protein
MKSLLQKIWLFIYSKKMPVLLCCMLFFFSAKLSAQEEKTTNENQQLLEILSEQSDSPFDFDTYLETLNDLKQNPLDLNSATYDDFKLLNILSAVQINNIIDYRNRINGFATVYELQAIENLDIETVKRILPYIKVVPIETTFRKQPLKQILFSGKYQIFTRYTQVLETQRGYTIEDTTRQRYLGSPQRYYIRYRYNFGTKLSYGITAEKDPGEEFFRGTQKQGFDFYSAHLFVRDVGIFKSIAIGDYNIKLGQGLAMWTGFGFRKTPAVMNLQRYAPALSAYTSVNEFNFMRGAATTIGIKRLDITAFVSYKNTDANVASTDTFDNEIFEVSSLQETGLHRTPNEVKNKNATTLFTTGGSIKYRFKKASVALNAVHNQLGANLLSSNASYRQFTFSGKSIANFSVDYNYILNNITFFGEAATNNKEGFALVNGALINTGTIIDIALLHRYYDKKYFSLQNNAFGESSSPTNESGLYAGFNLRPYKGFSINSYFDFYRFPWLKYLVDAPSRGFDYFGQINYRLNRNVEMHVRYRYETKQGNVPNNETKIDYLTDIERQSFRYHISYAINSKISLQNRIEYVWYNNNVTDTEKGFMIYQDIKLSPFRFPLSIYGRYTLFDTQSYNARIYAYENDILYSFSIPPLYDNGFRYYVLLKYDISENISVWLRFAQTQFSDATTIGSGLDQIEGNKRSEIKAQVRFRF